MLGAPQSHMLEWFDLKKRAQLKLKEAAKHPVPAGDWDNLLMRFRKLREGLTAAAAAAELHCEVYLVSADMCAAADNMAELLKCLQQLVNNIYPALEQQQQQQQQQQVPSHVASIQHQQQHQSQQHDVSEQHQQQRQHHNSTKSSTNQGSSRFESAWSDTSSNDSDPDGSSSSSDPLRRLPEVAAALLLYFVCVPRQPVIQEITKQLRAAARSRPGSRRQHMSTAKAAEAPPAPAAASPASDALISSPLYRQAVLDTAAALRCNWCNFLGSYFGQRHPLLVRAVMSHHVERMRIQAVRKLGVAYRMLPTAVFQRWLQLGCSSSSSRLGSDSSRGGNVQAPAACVGVATVASVASQDSVGCIAEVLKKAAASGSKAAGIAADRFVGQGEPSDTLYFRAR